MIAAAAIGPQPLHARHQLDDLQLLDLMVEPADFRFLQFDPPPFGGVGLGQRLDDLLNLSARRHTLLLQLQKRFLGRGTRFVRILENPEFAAHRAAAAGPAAAIARRSRCGCWTAQGSLRGT